MNVLEMVNDAEREGITGMIFLIMLSEGLSWIQSYNKIKEGR